MAFDVEKEIKIFLISGVIVLLVYGVWLFISPESYRALLGSSRYFNPVGDRMIGGIFIAWAIIAIRLIKISDNWEKIEEWILFTAIAEILITIAQLLGIILYQILSIGTIIAMIITIFFAIVAIHIFIQKRN